jgi:hypothetical protein
MNRKTNGINYIVPSNIRTNKSYELVPSVWRAEDSNGRGHARCALAISGGKRGAHPIIIIIIIIIISTINVVFSVVFSVIIVFIVISGGKCGSHPA